MLTGTRTREQRSTMADRRPRDRFDDAPTDLARVGAHRAPRRSRAFVTFAWAALATGLLVGAGVLALNTIEARNTTADPSTAVSVASTPKATLDPSIDVVILNGTTTDGLAASAAARAKSAGWKAGSVAPASADTVKTSTVYYTAKSQEGAALGLAKSLGIAKTALSAQFVVPGQSRLTVVLGKDYAAAQ